MRSHTTTYRWTALMDLVGNEEKGDDMKLGGRYVLEDMEGVGRGK